MCCFWETCKGRLDICQNRFSQMFFDLGHGDLSQKASLGVINVNTFDYPTLRVVEHLINAVQLPETKNHSFCSLLQYRGQGLKDLARPYKS